MEAATGDEDGPAEAAPDLQKLSWRSGPRRRASFSMPRVQKLARCTRASARCELLHVAEVSQLIAGAALSEAPRRLPAGSASDPTTLSATAAALRAAAEH